MALFLTGCTPSAEKSRDSLQPAATYEAGLKPPRISFGKNASRPLVTSWDGSGRASLVPERIDWKILPELPKATTILVDLDGARPPERVVVQSFGDVDSAGLPVAEGAEVLCTFADADQCELRYEPPEILRLKFSDDAVPSEYTTMQMSWLRLESDEVSEVWATWGMVVRDE